MTKVDQLESVSKSAVKAVSEHKTLTTKTVLVFTDQDGHGQHPARRQARERWASGSRDDHA